MIISKKVKIRNHSIFVFINRFWDECKQTPISLFTKTGSGMNVNKLQYLCLQKQVLGWMWTNSNIFVYKNRFWNICKQTPIFLFTKTVSGMFWNECKQTPISLFTKTGSGMNVNKLQYLCLLQLPFGDCSKGIERLSQTLTF